MMTERDELIIELRRQNKTYKQIANEVGCCLGIIRKTIRAYPGNDIQKEQFTSAMTFEQARDKYCPDGFELLEYHSGRTKGYVKLKCERCGHEFTKQMVSFRGVWSQCQTHCTECDRIEREQKKQQIEKEKRIKENERELARITEQLSFNICPVCSEVFGGRQRKYCSRECSRKAGRITHRHTRRAHLKTQMVDKDITLEALARRDHNKCWLCNEEVDWNDYVIVNGSFIVGERYPSLDHVIPLSKHGLHAWENVKLAHFRCNRDKRAKIV